MAKTEWHKRTGVSEDTARIAIVCKEDDRKQWTEEAQEHGYKNRSQYLYDLIQEARAYRQEGFLSHHQSEHQIEELENQVTTLKHRLAEKEKKHAGTQLVDDPQFIQKFLTTNYQSLSQILKDIVETGALDGLIRKQVEDQLYYLTAQDQVTYRRGHGWKLVNGGDR